MALYYQDDAVQVTSEAILAGGRRVPIAEIRYVWHAKGRTTLAVRGRVLSRGILVLLLSLPPLVAVFCALSLVWSAPERGWLPVLLTLAGCVLLALAAVPFLELPLGWLDRSYERGNRVHELWVQAHGRELLLLRTPDALRFGQIYRAVQRAVENHTYDR
ncbi:DUF6232 family protein [Salinispora arenicola]|uniref:Uncharacterized protein n=1 Tax=Salinispora arenicola TaxID=168697 RepID=A0A542XH18_SALAC|nr:DUF6232 family protein [Salinispora arenicola]MCN0153521.1 DUF6232 family protein [Salinispora arenicola]TQL35123.1 hypothetical protein FB564_0145 [Salinispora arenicola]GIM83241.1 hypothetical protein Sar04_11240 [Salinispora arenicola]